MTSVTIGNSVTSIGESAFSSCEGLTSVDIPNSVTSIGNHAFSDCIGLTRVTIGNSVTTIGEYAFYKCSGLTSVTIPNSVTSIGDDAFGFCTGLTSVTIPNSVTSIGRSAFGGCSGLTSLVVESGNKYYDSRDNCNAIIKTSTSCLIQGCKSTKIPEGICEIGEYAFGNIKGFSSIDIPNSVTEIGMSAFRDTDLEKVVLPNKLKVLRSLFEQCSKLKSIVIPMSVTEVSLKFLTHGQGLTCYIFNAAPPILEVGNECNLQYSKLYVPEGAVNTYKGAANWSSAGAIEEIKTDTIVRGLKCKFDFAFQTAIVDLSQSTNNNLVIPKAINYCGMEFPFDIIGDKSFNSIIVESGNPKYDSRDNCNAIIETATNTLIQGSSKTVIPKTVTTIGNFAFRDCTGLTSISIPNSVTTIGNFAFRDCTGLTSISIPNSVTSIGNSTFDGCTGLNSIIVESGNPKYDSRDNCNAIIETATNTLMFGCKATTIPNSVTSIGGDAFSGCTGLASITIPNTVTTIGEYAFYKCSGLTSIDIPNSVTSIGWRAFDGCTGLTSIDIPSSVTSIGGYAFSGCTGLTNVALSKSLTTIESGAFSGCTGLTSVTIPNSVTSIGSNSFSFCSSLTSVTIGNSVTSIGDWAFNGCSITRNLVLPESLKIVGNGAFGSALKCQIVEILAPVPPENFAQNFVDSYVKVLIVPKGCRRVYDELFVGTTIKVVERCNIEVTVPSASTLFDEILALRVSPSRVTGLIIHGSLKGEDLSWIKTNMTSLMSLDISDTDLTQIPDHSMTGHNMLEKIVLPNSLTTIGQNAFEGCIVLKEVILPSTLVSIGNAAFKDCLILKIDLPDGLQSIGNHAFYGCSLPYLYLPKNITYIGDYAFSNCYTKKVFIQEGFNCAASNLFERCFWLQEVILPSTLTRIGNGMFSYCYDLTSVYVEDDDYMLNTIDLSDCPNLKSIGVKAFENCGKIETINLPESLTTIGDGAFRYCKSVKHISSPAVVAPKLNVNGLPFEGINNDKCLLTIPTKSFRDYFQSSYWAGFMTFESKGEIEVETEDEDGFPFEDCNLYFKEGDDDSSSKPAMRMSRGIQIMKETLPGKTKSGFSLFVNDFGVAQIEIIPSLGTWIKSVFYDGNDVTKQLKRNIFVTPVVSANDLKKLKVVFYKNVPSGVESNNANDGIKVSVNNGMIEIAGAENAQIEVFDLSGQCVYSGMDTSIPVGKGIYIVRVAGTVHKVIL